MHSKIRVKFRNVGSFRNHIRLVWPVVFIKLELFQIYSRIAQYNFKRPIIVELNNHISFSIPTRHTVITIFHHSYYIKMLKVFFRYMLSQCS